MTAEFKLRPGNAVACRVNYHRHGWNGRVCQNAAAWDCGTNDVSFRPRECAVGNKLCYHIYTFDHDDPHVVIESNGGSWILGGDLHALDDQILLMYAFNAAEPDGRPSAADGSEIGVGLYRIKEVEKRSRGNYADWHVRPYPNGWARLPRDLRDPIPRKLAAGGSYVYQIYGDALQRWLQEIIERVGERREGWWLPDDQSRLKNFNGHLGEWLKTAEKARLRRDPESAKLLEYASPAPPNRALAKQLRDVKLAPKPPASAKPASTLDAPAPAPALTEPRALAPAAKSASPAVTPLLDAACEAAVLEHFGREVLDALRIGLMIKPILILRGPPGIGKSTLAGRLVDDEKRRLTVTVAATWRGREDLLGYVSPLDHQFEPSQFTEFLAQAAAAWDAGDTRTHVVVFEEFNLAQPEFWLSDILVRSEYAPSDRERRTIHLGGRSVRGWADGVTALFLAPNVKFIATVNDDHTTRALSPRVLDRAAIVDLSLDPREALARVALTLEADQLAAIEDLDQHARKKGAAFSLRTAMSLKSCLEAEKSLGLEPWKILDLVLAQEILARIRLMVGDPADHRLCDRLDAWSKKWAARLPDCEQTISAWSEALREGFDA